MKITGWTNWDDPNYAEYAAGSMAEVEARDDILIKEIREHGYKFTGDYHQNGDYGVPIIDDTWIYRASQRSWGHIMAFAYPDEIDNSDGMGYVAWAWSVPEGQKMVVPNERGD